MRASFLVYGLVCLLALLGAPATHALNSIAFHYGADAPLDELHAFDVAVVDPDYGFDPIRYRAANAGELFAYLSVGEVQPGRSWAGAIPEAWRMGANTTWGSVIIDQRTPQWPAFFADTIVAPLWQRGWRGFFLDTMDAYARLGQTADPQAQQRGLIEVVRTLRKRFPGIRLIANRGFELLPEIAPELEAIAAESLYRGYDASKKAYVEVREEDRSWLLNELGNAHTRYGLTAIAIDYVPPRQRALARETAERIRSQGMVPWVSDGLLLSLGVSTVEVMPRKIALLFDSTDAPAIHYRAAHRYAEMPLNYLGYVADYIDVRQELPTLDPSIYAGIVSWFDGELPPALQARYQRWLQGQIEAGLRVALFSNPGFLPDAAFTRATGLVAQTAPRGKIHLTAREAAIGFEMEPILERRRIITVRLADGKGESWARMADDQGQIYDGAGLAPWGGMALGDFAVVELAGAQDTARWVIDPFRFLPAALALPAMPVPETTSDSGRRMLFAHIDGDGLPSRAEFPGRPYAGQAMLDQILSRYRIPHAVSVIEGETSPAGLYPKDSAALEAIARKMFALPHVEIASHTYTHPFRWLKVEASEAGSEPDADYHLDVPDYIPSIEREISGSTRYINERLAPAGKPVKILLWSGDAAPSSRSMAEVARAGLLNMNGGNTSTTDANPTFTQVSALGAHLGAYFQVYAPVTNENIYTNLWRGPFDGFRHVIETFQLTGAPRRIKPIDIYYHMYAASKQASLRSLHEIYAWAMAQPTQPVFPSEFIRIAQSFNHAVIARTLADGNFVATNLGDLRSLRAPRSLGLPLPRQSTALAGYGAGPDGHYLILAAATATLRFGAADAGPVLAGANAHLTSSSISPDGQRFTLSGHRPIEFDLASTEHCMVSSTSHTLTGKPVGPLQRFHLDDATTATIDISCRRR